MAATPASTGMHEVQAFERVHEQLCNSIEQALMLPADHLFRAFHQIVTTVEADFRAEEELMESFDCADRHLHREQHARMQAGLHHAAAELEQGDAAPARQALAALRDWLVFHSATQDRHLHRQLQRTAPPAHPAEGDIT